MVQTLFSLVANGDGYKKLSAKLVLTYTVLSVPYKIEDVGASSLRLVSDMLITCIPFSFA